MQKGYATADLIDQKQDSCKIENGVVWVGATIRTGNNNRSNRNSMEVSLRLFGLTCPTRPSYSVTWGWIAARCIHRENIWTNRFAKLLLIWRNGWVSITLWLPNDEIWEKLAIFGNFQPHVVYKLKVVEKSTGIFFGHGGGVLKLSNLTVLTV